jgi:hypothetical protein
MTAPALETIEATREKLAQLHAPLFEDLRKLEGTNGARLEADKPIPGLTRSLTELNSRIVALIGLLTSVKDVSDVLVVPSTYIGGLQKALEQLLTHEGLLRDQLDAIKDPRCGWQTNGTALRIARGGGDAD